MSESANKKILLAEDNPVNQKVATMLLQQLGLSADIVSDGHKAVKAVEKNQYAVILMDCQMPLMDGFEATKAIRKIEASTGTYTPIIAVTALAMVGDRERCIAVGMDDYISKPIDRQVLKIKLNHWMQREFVLRNQELARKYAQVVPPKAADEPINLAELEEFYSNDLDEVLGTFVESTDALLREMSAAINKHSDAELAHMAHELKGSSASVGAKNVAKLALFLERAAGIGDWTEVRDTFSALTEAFTSVKEFLSERRTPLPTEAVIRPNR